MTQSSLGAVLRRRVAPLAAVAGLLLAAALVPAAYPASAATGDLVCPEVHVKLTFSPALSASNPNSDVTIDAIGGPTPCYSPNGNFGPGARYDLATTWHGYQDKGITAALSPTGGPGVCGLTFAINMGSPGFPYVWENRNYPASMVQGTISTNPAEQPGATNAHLVNNLSFVRGPATGAYIQAIVPVASVNSDCATNGLREVTLSPLVAVYG